MLYKVCQGTPAFWPTYTQLCPLDSTIHSATQTRTPTLLSPPGLIQCLAGPLLWNDPLDLQYFHFTSHTTFPLSRHFIIYYFCHLCIQVYNSVGEVWFGLV